MDVQTKYYIFELQLRTSVRATSFSIRTFMSTFTYALMGYVVVLCKQKSLHGPYLQIV